MPEGFVETNTETRPLSPRWLWGTEPQPPVHPANGLKLGLVFLEHL